MLASQLPTPQTLSGTYAYLEDADVSVGATTPLARTFDQGDTTTVPASLSRNGANLDVLASYGAGVIGVVHGLVPVGATGLTIDISAGGALAGGVLQSKDGFTAEVVFASSTNFIWIKQDGTIEVVDDDPTPPAGVAVYIGAAITDGSGVTSIDLTGVVYIFGGNLYRETDDPDVPSDLPPTDWFGYTRTGTGVFLFDGASYVNIVPDTSSTISVEPTSRVINTNETEFSSA